MDSTVPFPLPGLHPHGEISVALETFRWLVVFGFPVAVAAATVWPDFFAAGDAKRAASVPPWRLHANGK